MVLNIKKLIFASWPAFIAVALATQLFYFQLYTVKFRVTIMLTLAAINFLQGIYIVIDSHFNRWKIVIVTSAFIFAQWWLFTWLTVITLWKIHGFAP